MATSAMRPKTRSVGRRRPRLMTIEELIRDCGDMRREREAVTNERFVRVPRQAMMTFEELTGHYGGDCTRTFVAVDERSGVRPTPGDKCPGSQTKPAEGAE